MGALHPHHGPDSDVFGNPRHQQLRQQQLPQQAPSQGLRQWGQQAPSRELHQWGQGHQQPQPLSDLSKRLNDELQQNRYDKEKPRPDDDCKLDYSKPIQAELQRWTNNWLKP